MGVLITYYYPFIMAVVFLVVLFLTKIPAKGQFLLRALVALAISLIFAHVNRWFNFWPEYRFFPSGHMTFCLGIAVSLGMLQRWTLAVTLPLLILFGYALVFFGFHSYLDVLGAIPLILIVYGSIHRLWRLPSAAPPLDMVGDSP